MIKKQKFGVEIEMTGITRKSAADIIGEVLEHEASTSAGGCYKTRTIFDNKGRVWKVMRDSSINPRINDNTNDYIDEYKVEIVTPPLDYDDIEVLQTIVRKLRHQLVSIFFHQVESTVKFLSYIAPSVIIYPFLLLLGNFVILYRILL